MHCGDCNFSFVVWVVLCFKSYVVGQVFIVRLESLYNAMCARCAVIRCLDWTMSLIGEGFRVKGKGL